MTFIRVISLMVVAACYYHLIAVFMAIVTTKSRSWYLSNDTFEWFFGVVSVLLALITVYGEGGKER